MPNITPYYDKDGITIHCGDNCDVLGTFPRECVDLIVTSPPYDDVRTYGGHSWDFYGVAWQLKRVLKPGGVLVWIVNDGTYDGDETGTSYRQALHFKEIGLRLHDTMIYKKNSLSFPETNRYYPNFEFMFVFSSGNPITVNLIADRPNRSAGKLISGTKREADGLLSQKCGARKGNKIQQFGVRWNVWEFAIGNGHTAEERYAHKHPAMFPEDLARDHILSWSNEGDTVLDPFNGSGTTTKMARELRRKAIGIDINESYCEIAVLRLEQKLFSFTG